jgi:hypothetical protein
MSIFTNKVSREMHSDRALENKLIFKPIPTSVSRPTLFLLLHVSTLKATYQPQDSYNTF